MKTKTYVAAGKTIMQPNDNTSVPSLHRLLAYESELPVLQLKISSLSCCMYIKSIDKH